MLARLKRGVRVFSHQYLAISSFDRTTLEGVFSKYTEIDSDEDWFDLDTFETVSPEAAEQQVTIPKNLKPNHTQFYFTLHPRLHCITFESYSKSKRLSPKMVEKYLRGAFRLERIIGEFGLVQADVIKSYDAVDSLMELPNLKELHFEIRRPNTDDLTDDLAAVIEARLNSVNGVEYQETIKAGSGASLEPDDRTRALGRVAAENGRVAAKNVENGIIRRHDTEETPLLEVEVHSNEEGGRAKSNSLMARLVRKIREVRRGNAQD